MANYHRDTPAESFGHRMSGFLELVSGFFIDTFFEKLSRAVNVLAKKAPFIHLIIKFLLYMLIVWPLCMLYALIYGTFSIIALFGYGEISLFSLFARKTKWGILFFVLLHIFVIFIVVFPLVIDNGYIICDDDIVISQSDQVRPGQVAYIEVKVKPNTKYDIDVYYSSGASKAGGLEPKRSDENGVIRWSWKVGTITSYGTYDIKIRGNFRSYTATFKVGD